MPTKPQIATTSAGEPQRHAVAGYVDGRFKGTTDEIIQWAAKKWGFQPDLFRAVARNESYWDMNMLGDRATRSGSSRFAGRTTAACPSCGLDRVQRRLLRRHLRAYFDGEQDWLNNPDVAVNEHPGPLSPATSGAASAPGSPATGTSRRTRQYVRDVQRWMDERPWANDEYFAEPWYKPHPE